MASDVTSADWQQEKETELEQDGLALELAVLSLIASRIVSVDSSTTYAQARMWQAEDMAKIKRLMSEGANLLTSKSDEIMADMAESSDKWAGEYYTAAGVEQNTIENDPYMSQTLRAGKEANDLNVKNYCRTSVLNLLLHDGKRYRIDQAYQSMLDNAINIIKTGRKDYGSAIEDIVVTLAKGGVRVEYKSGATRELYSAVSQNVMDGFRGTMQTIRNQQAEQFGADGVEVSAHGMCADDHRPYQGKQFTKAEFEQIQSKMRRPIGKGYNCRHMVTGVILGVSNPAHDKKLRDKYDKQSSRDTGIQNGQGGTYNAYDFTQWQRNKETQIRKIKAEAMVLESAGIDATKYRADARRQTEYYKSISKKAKVETRLERTQVYSWKQVKRKSS